MDGCLEMSTFGKQSLNNRKSSPRYAPGAIVLLLCGAGLISGAAISAEAGPGDSSLQMVRFDDSTAFERNGRPDVREAVTRFVSGMTAGNAQTVWMYASEEDQAAFGTEGAVYEAFAEVFPALTQAEEVTFRRGWQEGDTPFVDLALTDRRGDEYEAVLGLWLDDAGDWKIVSAEVAPAADFVASR